MSLFYRSVADRVGTLEALDLADRLATWHDRMVMHERRLRGGRSGAACSESCPHAEARPLWSEARQVFGAWAEDLIFLRSRAIGHQGQGRLARAETVQ